MFYRFTTFIFLIGTSTTLYAQAPTQVPTPQAQAINDSYTTVSNEHAASKEDWTAISLAKSGLDAEAAGGAVISKVEFGECTRELVRAEWRPNDPIDIYVIRPKGVNKPPVMLFLLNYTFDTDVFREPAWCKEAQQNSVTTVGFGSALSLQRFHSPHSMRQWFVSELQEALGTSTHDVQMVLNYLDQRGDLDMKHVGMLGQGSGGAIAILAAAADPRITALDLLDPWGDWPDWIKESKQIPEQERATYLEPKFLAKVANLDPMIFLPQLKLKALRVQQVTSDLVTQPSARGKIAAAVVDPKSVVRYADNTSERQAWGESGISGWMTAQLHLKGTTTDKAQ